MRESVLQTIPWRGTQALALAAGAAAIAVRWALGSLTVASFPPGLLILALAAVVVAAIRRALATIVGLAGAGLVAVQLITVVDPALWSAGRGSTAVQTALWLEAVAVSIALMAGAVSLVLHARALHRDPADRPDYARYAQTGGLLVLAPICAEYLAAYDDSTGNAYQLLAGLLIFVPLYGCSALLIREIARRARLGWFGIVLLATAFGLLQAGVVDQSLSTPTTARSRAGRRVSTPL